MQLDGLRVVDLTTLLPGPYATQLLADAGAEVIKVERPGTGDEARAMAAGGAPDVFSAVNRGKRSVAIDLGTPEGQAAFEATATDADVVIEGFRPGVVERLGVDYDSVREYNPDVVYCSITGYGATGPHRDRAGEPPHRTVPVLRRLRDRRGWPRHAGRSRTAVLAGLL